MAAGDPLQEAADGFFVAAEHGRSDVIKALADHGEGKLNLAEIVDPKTGRSPLHVAVANRKTDALRVLLTAGFPPNVDAFDDKSVSSDREERRTPYALALAMNAHDLVFVFHQFAIQQVAMNSVDGVRQLLESGIPVDMTDGAHGNTLLHWAVTCRAVDVMRYLLELEGVQIFGVVDQANADGATPLHLASRDGQVELVRLLLAHNANPRCTGTKGDFKDKTALDLVASTTIRDLLNQQEESTLVANRNGHNTTGDDHAVKQEEERRAGRTTASEDDITPVDRKHALELEEKDMLIRQLKHTIEALVVESQEIRKLGEERTVLDYIRRLREEKAIVQRQLEDAEDYIRIQQQQITELKQQIRGMVSSGQTLDIDTASPADNTSDNNPRTKPTLSPEATAFSETGESTGSEPLMTAFDSASVEEAMGLLQIDPPSSRRRATPPTSSRKSSWNTVLGVVWGASESSDVDADGEVIMTV
ncbi:hypothetical protein PINS_up002091 [Pythium insidiosum]|nr:hypothetical protein PINS_up002091 [Pythium insidiosum]